jgi:hypothetical protein
MAKRLSTVKVDASKVQGEGAYIEWRRMTWGERKLHRDKAKAGEFDPVALILQSLVSWNWVDGDGNPMPLLTSEADLDALYDEEVTYLADVAIRAMQGKLELTREAEKN